MTREAFIQRWRDHLAGMALRGLVHDRDPRPIGEHTAGAYALKIPERVDSLLERLWLDAQPQPSDKPPANGQPQPVRKT